MFRGFLLFLSLFGFSPCFAEIESAYFSGGSFWGIEAFFEYERGVTKTTVGYMGGSSSNPTYNEVCSGLTGHAETVEIQFDKTLTDYSTIARFFFEIHDPSQKFPQGSQYRSVVFYLNESQKQTALNLIAQLKRYGISVVTELQPAVSFYPAEEYHQRHYAKKGTSPCRCRKKNYRWDS